ncbi:UNVERIFIED_CONTAM: hypothetical protein Slati_2263800 [Sesamum latifolium]|uniref:Uncharacterized protein n=1 Tax=Sesamum latifolium TaxID=2727402 RepID=A0AAW2WX94_9LAMI
MVAVGLAKGSVTVSSTNPKLRKEVSSPAGGYHEQGTVANKPRKRSGERGQQLRQLPSSRHQISCAQPSG